ncbi:MAG: protein tyrosine phosphatase family protein [Devosia sp.]
MNARKIDDQFSVTGQITPEQVKDVAGAGYRAIVCARPDNEEGGQPSFDDVAREAERQGLQIVHIPVSGPLSEGQIILFHEAMKQIPRPVLGYCRSGARASSLYATLSK